MANEICSSYIENSHHMIRVSILLHSWDTTFIAHFFVHNFAAL